MAKVNLTPVMSRNYSNEAKKVAKILFDEQKKIIKNVQSNPNTNFDAPEDTEYYIKGLMGNEYYAIGICYCEDEYYICFGDIFGMSIEYLEYGEHSETPFTEEQIARYVDDVYYQMFSY